VLLVAGNSASLRSNAEVGEYEETVESVLSLNAAKNVLRRSGKYDNCSYTNQTAAAKRPNMVNPIETIVKMGVMML
jgi:hypothetical protein